MESLLDSFLNAALALAQDAGKEIMKYYGTTQSVKKDDGTPVTLADKASDQIIVGGLERRFPRHSIISEERPPNGKRSEFTWMVDPLDGTADFLQQTGEFTVQIAMLWGARPTVGVVYAPAKNKLYYAEYLRNEAFVTDDEGTRALAVSGRTRSEARLVLSRKDFKDPAQVEAMKQSLGVAEVLQAGSFGYKVGLIAEGKAEAYVNTSQKAAYWDALPPEIILQVAGGKTTDYDGQELAFYREKGCNLPRGAVCTNGVFHDEFLERVRNHCPLK